MAGEHELLQKILSAINKKQDLNKDNIIQKIQEELNKQYQDLYEEWEKSGFDVNHRFGLGDLECLKPALLTIAALHGHANIVEVLLGAKANVNEKDISGCTALHYAALHGHTNIIEVLLGAKANVNEKDYYYGTALHYVASNGNAEAAELLIKKGANVNAVDRFGRTPLDYAKSKNVLEALLKAAFVQASKKAMVTGGATALLGTAIAAVFFATETIAIPIAIAVVAVIALAVGGATYMMLKLSTKVDGVAVLMDEHQETAL